MSINQMGVTFCSVAQHPYCKLGLSVALLSVAVTFFVFTDAPNGVRGATYAIAAASALFVRLIRTEPTAPLRRTADLANGMIAAALTFLAGWHWLESEAGGDLWPAFAPAVAFWIVGLVSLFLSVAGRREEPQGKK